MTTSTAQKPQPMPEALAAVALIAAPACAAAGSMKVSWWYGEVAAGRAPQPVIRRPRCTRWLASDVAEFWRKFAADSQADTRAAEAVKLRAGVASAAALRKRRAASGVTPVESRSGDGA